MKPRPQSLFRQTLDSLGHDIVSGRWADGEPIAPDTIGTDLRLSRTTVREAIRVLEDKGMIAARPNVGTLVRPARYWNLLDPDVARWIAESPRHAALQVQAKEFVSALRAIAPDLGANPHLRDALAALDPGGEAA